MVEEEDVAPPKRKVAAAEPPSPFVPDPASVQRYGPAYRYPQAGWIVLHVEGKPYERGYQHGKLLAPEIAAHVRCFAAMNGPSAPAEAWRQTRLLANALFLRRFDPEYLEEMKGIADGAAAAGAKFDNRPIDLTDVAALNLWAEIETLPGALEATPTGLEGKLFPHEQPKAMPRPKPEHCSAFAAAGPATADGQIVFGHITMFALYPATLYNVWLDLKPEKGRRVLMQTYPGGIQSGMDYYLNDAGLLVCETTIRQTRFHGNGEALASRIRKALQYADSIDGAVRILREGNNGLYTNEWLLADVKTNEIAMFELGTHKSKLWRSSKNEWYGNTPGFYWGCNNTKDLEVRLETLASVEGRPANVVFRPSDRDKCWQRLYREHKGKIDADFGKLAFTTPPVAAYHSLDAKFTTTDLARGLKTWALFGPPLGKTWQPTPEERKRYPETRPLVSNPWTVLHAEPPAKGTKVAAVDLKGRLDPAEREPDRRRRSDDPPTVPAWHGTILPRSDADVWLAAAFSDYERYCAREKALRQQAGATGLSQEDRERLAVDLFAYRSSYLAAARAAGDVALARTRSGVTEDHWYRIAAGKGVLLLHELRKQLGDAAFGGLMEQFGRANAGKPVSAAQFQELAERVSGKKLGDLFDAWLQRPGLPKEANGAAYSVLSFLAELDRTLIVYGTADEFHANREAAEALQRALVERGPNITVPIRADRGVTDEELKGRHLLLIGRPDSNSVVGRFRDSWPVRFGSRSFVVGRDTYAHMNSAVVFAADNPLNPRYSAVVIAGLSAR
ncbi:MAG TPA: C45 family autoproteolytic acyltransferase/hydrolase, partial [Gemmataceae bacterium]|nr:C45 family autoproteolytic acyltransferase/hydrolase [Gemmataceae bacterium]